MRFGRAEANVAQVRIHRGAREEKKWYTIHAFFRSKGPEVARFIYIVELARIRRRTCFFLMCGGTFGIDSSSTNRPKIYWTAGFYWIWTGLDWTGNLGWAPGLGWIGQWDGRTECSGSFGDDGGKGMSSWHRFTGPDRRTTRLHQYVSERRTGRNDLQ